MRNDIQESCIAVPVPTALYVNVVDQMSKAHMDCKPTTLVTSILQKYLDDARKALPSPSPMKSARDWSNDWIMFGSPPPITKGKTQTSRKKSKTLQSTDWCIGCGCPSEDLLSS